MKYRSLESFRGIAAILVALFHSAFVVSEQYTFIAHSAIFVDFFFILSGFVIAFAYNDRIKEGFSFREFFLLRLGRLYPLHLFILMIWLPYIIVKTIAFHKFGIGETDPALHNGIGAFFSNLFLINALGVHDYLSWNYPAWSISVEFFTYMIFFACISFGRQLNDLLLSLCMSVLCYVILYLNNPDTLLKTYDWGLMRCLGGFFLGSAIYRISQKIDFKQSILLATSLEFLTVSLMILLVLNSSTIGYQMAAFLSFSLVILTFAIQEKGLITKLLTLKPLLFLGSLSYSIYMTHALVLAVFATLGKKLFKLPVKTVVEGEETFVHLLTPFADLINLILLCVIAGISYVTYTFIEVPWRDKFRAYTKKQRPLVSNTYPV